MVALGSKAGPKSPPSSASSELSQTERAHSPISGRCVAGLRRSISPCRTHQLSTPPRWQSSLSRLLDPSTMVFPTDTPCPRAFDEISAKLRSPT